MKKTAGMLKSKTASISFKVVTFYGMLVLLILAFLGCLLFSYLQSQFERERKQMLEGSLSQADLLFSQYIKSAEDQARLLFSSSNGCSVRMKAPIQEDLQMKFLQELRNAVNVNPSIHSIYVINQQNKVVLHASGTSNYSVSLDDMLPKRLDQQEYGDRPFVWTVPGWLPDKEDVSLLCIYIRDASSHSRYYTGAIVVHLDLNWISANLFSSSKQSDYTQFYIIDDRGYVIAHSEKKYYGEDWSQRSGVHQILNGNLLDNTEKENGKTYEINAIASRERGFYIIARSNHSDQIQGITNILLLIALVILAAYIGTIAASCIMSRKLFAPLRMMIRNIQNSSVMHQLTEYRGDELQYMEEYYRNVSSYIDRLERTSHRDLIAKNLILGNNVQPLINKWGILHPNANYYAVLAYMTEEASSGRLEDYVTRCNRVSELISIDLSQYGKCTWFEISFRRCLFLLTETSRDSRDINRLLQRAFEDFGGAGYLVVVQSSADGKEPLHHIFKEMNDRLKTRILLRPEPQILTSPADVSDGMGKVETERILACLKDGDKDVYREAIDAFLDSMADASWELFSQKMEELIAQIMVAHASVPAMGDNLQLGQKRIRGQLDSITSRDELVNWMMQLFDRTNTERQKMNLGNAISLMENAMTYMQNNYSDSTLNANILARKMNISASYFGKLFKQFAGVSVSEYLTKLRMERAYNLFLLTPDEEVAKIAMAVGYSNAGYFATVFRKYYGVSPSKLRNYAVVKKNEAEKDE